MDTMKFLSAFSILPIPNYHLMPIQEFSFAEWMQQAIQKDEADLSNISMKALAAAYFAS